LIRFLIDECLSPKLLADAYAAGFEAHHVNTLGLTSQSDRALMVQIIGGDFTFVTNNARDFLRLYTKVDLHAGLIVILPSGEIAEQRALFRAAMAAIIAAGNDITGELVEVDRDGTVTFRHYPDPLGND
jgi:predicted nuclease of predicted toxin-antitoxin system